MLSFCSLHVTDNEIQTIPWASILEKVVQSQSSQQLCVVKDLSAHDVVMRLMRKENYLIGMLNKGVLAFPISRWVPGAGPTVKFGSNGVQHHLILTKTLEWTLNWCILQSMFDRYFSFCLYQSCFLFYFILLLLLNFYGYCYFETTLNFCPCQTTCLDLFDTNSGISNVPPWFTSVWNMYYTHRSHKIYSFLFFILWGTVFASPLYIYSFWSYLSKKNYYFLHFLLSYNVLVLRDTCLYHGDTFILAFSTLGFNNSSTYTQTLVSSYIQ